MKTIFEIRSLIEEQVSVMSLSSQSSPVFKKAKTRYDFLNECLLLIEQGLTERQVNEQVEKLSKQVKGIKARYKEWWVENAEDMEMKKGWSTKKFYTRTGAGKVKKQLRTYKFLQK